jgi:hypothetical protein
MSYSTAHACSAFSKTVRPKYGYLLLYSDNSFFLFRPFFHAALDKNAAGFALPCVDLQDCLLRPKQDLDTTNSCHLFDSSILELLHKFTTNERPRERAMELVTLCRRYVQFCMYCTVLTYAWNQSGTVTTHPLYRYFAPPDI